MGTFFKHQRTKRWLLRIAIVLAVILLISIVAQLIYPSDRATSGVRVAGSDVFWQTQTEIEQVAKQKLPQTKIRLQLEGKPKDILLKDLGGSYCTSCVAKQAADYPLWQRLMPFSLFWRSNQVDIAKVSFDKERLSEIIKVYEPGLQQVPIDATIAIKSEKAVIMKERPGKSISFKQMLEAVSKTPYPLGKTSSVDPKGTPLPASVTASQLGDLKKQADAALKRPFTLAYEDVRAPVSTSLIADWLSFNRANDQALPVMSLDHEKFSTYLQQSFGEKIIRKAGITTIDMFDGVETKRQTGVTGRGIEVPSTKEQSLQVLRGDVATKEVSVATKTTQPKISYKDSFSKSQRGLQAYLNSLSRDHDIRVSIKQLDGAGWSAQSRGSEASVAASTYKLYVAIYVLDKVEKNEWQMDDTINGITTRACLDKMIVVSDNGCPEAFIDKFGRKNIMNYLRERGFSPATNFQNVEYTSTSTNDLIRVLSGIQDGSLVKGDNRSFLLGLMAKQVYRQGVPAGSAGTVQDKVGFLWGYLNDAAIVRHPRGAYAIAIITDKQSWGKLAEITRKVEELVY